MDSVGLAESITKNLVGRSTTLIILFGLHIPRADRGHNLRQVTKNQAAASLETRAGGRLLRLQAKRKVHPCQRGCTSGLG